MVDQLSTSPDFLNVVIGYGMHKYPGETDCLHYMGQYFSNSV